MTSAPMTGESHMSALFDLTGKVALVTGSTKGLGRAMAQGLAEAGASVIVSSRKQDLCDVAASEIATSTGRDTAGIACHVGDWDAIPGLVEQIVERFGRIDVVVNNAGINPSWVGMADMPLDLWRKVFSVNLEGPLRLSQLVAPIMRDNGGGSIVNVATMGAYGGGAGVGAYGPSKAGLLSLTRICATEWAPWKVRVNAVSPGPIRSEMTDGAERTAPGFYERAGNATMLKRVADTHEIIGPVVYLASDASSFVTGEDHLVSGGMLR
jgi:NAD(P)-dependent dehydrogenase (short-subunit alcohol dehydrogenase family)